MTVLWRRHVYEPLADTLELSYNAAIASFRGDLLQGITVQEDEILLMVRTSEALVDLSVQQVSI